MQLFSIWYIVLLSSNVRDASDLLFVVVQPLLGYGGGLALYCAPLSPASSVNGTKPIVFSSPCHVNISTTQFISNRILARTFSNDLSDAFGGQTQGGRSFCSPLSFDFIIFNLLWWGIGALYMWSALPWRSVVMDRVRFEANGIETGASLDKDQVWKQLISSGVIPKTAWNRWSPKSSLCVMG
jgi:hypothetical protein